MFKLTKSDLSIKSNAQLSAIFLQVSQEIQTLDLASAERRTGLATLALISNEQARRNAAGL